MPEGGEGQLTNDSNQKDLRGLHGKQTSVDSKYSQEIQNMVGTKDNE
jgi:hypothetical protein